MRYQKTQFQICLEHFLHNQYLIVLRNPLPSYIRKRKLTNLYFNLLTDDNFKTLHSSLFNKYAGKRIEPFKHALDFLVSSNILINSEDDIYYTYLPSVSLSAFSCELHLKAWIVEDKNDELKSEYHGVTFIHYKGSQSGDYLTKNKVSGPNRHNLKLLFIALPDQVKEFHNMIFDNFYKQFFGMSLLEALDKTHKYFIDVRYYFEDISKRYDLNLVNNLANFFYEAVLFLQNWDGKVYLEKDLKKN